MKQRFSELACIISGFLATAAVAQADPTLSVVPEPTNDTQALENEQLQQKIDGVIQKYQPTIDHNTKTIDENKDEKDPIIVKGDCWWDETSAKLHVPKTTFKNRDFRSTFQKQLSEIESSHSIILVATGRWFELDSSKLSF